MSNIDEETRAAVVNTIRAMGRRFPAYAGDLSGVAWIRVLERRARGGAETPERAGRVAWCAMTDWLRTELTRDALRQPEAGPGDHGGGGAQPPAASPAMVDMRRAWGTLGADDQATLAAVALDGVAPVPRSPDGRSLKAWRRYHAALGRARAAAGVES